MNAHIFDGASDVSVEPALWDGAECASRVRGHRGWVTALAVSPNGRHVVSGGGDGRVRLWTFVEVGLWCRLE